MTSLINKIQESRVKGIQDSYSDIDGSSIVDTIKESAKLGAYGTMEATLIPAFRYAAEQALGVLTEEDKKMVSPEQAHKTFGIHIGKPTRQRELVMQVERKKLYEDAEKRLAEATGGKLVNVAAAFVGQMMSNLVTSPSTLLIGSGVSKAIHMAGMATLGSRGLKSTKKAVDISNLGKVEAMRKRLAESTKIMAQNAGKVSPSLVAEGVANVAEEKLIHHLNAQNGLHYNFGDVAAMAFFAPAGLAVLRRGLEGTLRGFNMVKTKKPVANAFDADKTFEVSEIEEGEWLKNRLVEDNEVNVINQFRDTVNYPAKEFYKQLKTFKKVAGLTKSVMTANEVKTFKKVVDNDLFDLVDAADSIRKAKTAEDMKTARASYALNMQPALKRQYMRILDFAVEQNIKLDNLMPALNDLVVRSAGDIEIPNRKYNFINNTINEFTHSRKISDSEALDIFKMEVEEGGKLLRDFDFEPPTPQRGEFVEIDDAGQTVKGKTEEQALEEYSGDTAKAKDTIKKGMADYNACLKGKEVGQE